MQYTSKYIESSHCYAKANETSILATTLTLRTMCKGVCGHYTCEQEGPRPGKDID